MSADDIGPELRNNRSTEVAIRPNGVQQPIIRLIQPKSISSGTVKDTPPATIQGVINCRGVNHQSLQKNQSSNLSSSLATGYLHDNANSKRVLVINNTHNMADEGSTLHGKQLAVNSLETDKKNLSEHGSVNRQFSSASLCSWNSFDTSLTDDNISDEETSKPVNIVAGGKVDKLTLSHFTRGIGYCFKCNYSVVL